MPGVVVEHKHLDAVFDWIAAQQRTRMPLASPTEAHAPREAADSGCHTVRVIRDVIVPTPPPRTSLLGTKPDVFTLC